MATTIENITLEEAIRKSHSMMKEKNTFIWKTKENIFDYADFSEGFAFNSICVMWGKHTYAFTCYVTVDTVPHTADNDTFIIGTNKNNGYFASLEELRRAYPKLFEVKGEFKAILTLW